MLFDVVSSYIVKLVMCCRLFDDEKKAKMGVVECVKHELMQPFGVLFEREGKSRPVCSN